jgi:cytochrome c oxidase assembly protein subunit 15
MDFAEALALSAGLISRQCGVSPRSLFAVADLSLSRTSVRDIASAHVRGRTGAVSIWLWCVAALVMLMVVVGGATRLTESGLSITEWKPITGVIPPLTHDGWQQAFDKYKQIPQYQTLFPDMDLGRFQTIFLWEWTHRLIGRLLGFALLVPLIVFWVRGMLSTRLKWQMLGIFALGGLQGFVGWWMVSSGLSGRVEVAQERLATHLLLASITLTALVWLASGQRRTDVAERVPAALRHLATVMIVLVLAQIALGGLVAGLRAGQAYNTWPLMNGHFIPPAGDLGMLTPLWRNLVDNITMVQFQHRMTAYLLLALALLQAVRAARTAPGTSAARRSIAILGLVTTQAVLGVITLVLVVPLWAGLLHQAFAMLVLIMTVVHRQRLSAKALDCPEPARADRLQTARA